MQLFDAFPIAIIDEDYEGKNAAGRGMQQLAAAIEKEGFRVVAGISYKDARRLVKIFNNESCWLISVDGSEDAETRWQVLEEVLATKRKRNDRLPIFLFGDELTAEMVPTSVLKHANAFMRLFEDSAEFMARAIVRAAQLYLERLPAADVQGADGLHAAGQLLLAHAGPRRRRRLPQEPGRSAVLRVLRREHLAVRYLGVGRQARLAARPHRSDRRRRAQCRPNLRSGRDAVRRGRHIDRQQDRLARHGQPRRPGSVRPQLPQVDPALADHDRRHTDLSRAVAQRPGHHRPDLQGPVHAASRSRRRSPPARSPRRPTARSA